MIEPRDIRILFNTGDVRSAINTMAVTIAKDHVGTATDPLVLVIVLNGGFMFGADLCRALYGRGVHSVVEFLQCSSYEGKRSSGKVKFVSLPRTNLGGRRVLIVEDIVDSGLTLKEIKTKLYELHPKIASLRVAALVDKFPARKVVVQVDYTGLRIPERFVVGFGLDDEGLYRELPFIGFIDTMPGASDA